MTVVSSYLVCEVCGAFGPPAGFIKEDGLRLCYQCWYQQWRENNPSTTDNDALSNEDLAADSFSPTTNGTSQSH